MWVVTGPFDGETIGEVNFHSMPGCLSVNIAQLIGDHSESKLLKPGKQYVLGRKKKDLIVNHKSISSEHLAIIVGEYTEEDVVRVYWFCS